MTSTPSEPLSDADVSTGVSGAKPGAADIPENSGTSPGAADSDHGYDDGANSADDASTAYLDDPAGGSAF